MTYRPAAREDIPALAELVIACDLRQRDWAGPDVPTPAVEQEELEWQLRFARTDAWVHVAADEDDGRITGVVAWSAATAGPGSRELVPGLAHVSAVFVAPDRWREGIASDLLDLAEDAMRVGGYERAQLWTLAGSPAEHFYRARGWVADGRRDHYPPMGLDTVAYVRALRGVAA